MAQVDGILVLLRIGNKILMWNLYTSGSPSNPGSLELKKLNTGIHCILLLYPWAVYKTEGVKSWCKVTCIWSKSQKVPGSTPDFKTSFFSNIIQQNTFSNKKMKEIIIIKWYIPMYQKYWWEDWALPIGNWYPPSESRSQRMASCCPRASNSSNTHQTRRSSAE